MSIYRDKANGCFVFEFDRRINGRRVRLRKHLPKTWRQSQADTFDRQESARLYALATNVERHRYSIEDAVNVYLLERVPQLKSAGNIARELGQMFWVYAGKPLDELAEVCRQYSKQADRADEEAATPLSPATVRNRIRYLTAACRYAWKHHGMSENDPASRVVVPTVRNERRHYINRREMLTLARACPNRSTRAAIRIAFYSGMRVGEILRAERGDGVFVLHDTKNGEPRMVPMHPKLATCSKIKLIEQSHIARHFRKARAAVDMDWLHFHDLRHSAASEMINNEVDLYTVGAVLGHKSAASTKRYAHLATKALRMAIGKIGQKIPHHKKKGIA